MAIKTFTELKVFFDHEIKVTSLKENMLVCTQTLLVFVGPWQGGQKVGRQAGRKALFWCVFRSCFVKTAGIMRLREQLSLPRRRVRHA